MKILKTGETYGKLTLIQQIIKMEPRKNRNPVPTKFWICSCDCGIIKDIREGHIISGRSKSCGCNKKVKRGHINPNAIILTKDFLYNEYIINKKSVPTISKEINVSRSWIEIKIKEYNIKKRTNKDNGFPNRAKEASIKALWKGYEDISGAYFCSIQKSAQDRGLSFNITLKDMWDQYIKQNRKCALTDLDIGFYPRGGPRNTKLLQTASLDRIDSKQGYIIGNIQWLHKDINKMKWEKTQKEFVNYCHMIVNKDNKGEIKF